MFSFSFMLSNSHILCQEHINRDLAGTQSTYGSGNFVLHACFCSSIRFSLVISEPSVSMHGCIFSIAQVFPYANKCRRVAEIYIHTGSTL